MASTDTMNQTEKRHAVSLASIFGLRMLGLFLIMPVLAIFGQNYPDYSPMLVGIAIGAYGLTQAFLQIPMGMLSDRIGRKPVIVAGLLLFTIGSVVAAAAPTLGWVIVGRVLQGAGAIAGAILALAADVARPEQRPKVMATIGMGIGLSFVVALVAAPVLAEYIGISGIFWVTAILSALAALFVVQFIQAPQQAAGSREVIAVPDEMKQLLKNTQLLRLQSGVGVLHLVLTAWFVSFPINLIEAGLNASWHGLAYLVTVLVSFAVMIPFMLWVIRRQKTVLGIRVGALFLLIGFAVIASFSQQLPALMLGVTLFFVGFNYLEATLPAQLSQHAPAGSKGSASGIYTTFQFFGAFLGGTLGGAISAWGGHNAVMIFCIVLLLCWLLVTTGMKAEKPTTRVTLSLPEMSGQQANLMAEQLTQLQGVEEASVVHTEQTAYLKVDPKLYKPEAVKTLLSGVQ
ncbi:MFS transporter [Lysobacter sp. N42]|uniref:MFS transporter n=1 Tax=Lysobacter sp. N42 TaxID=2545719 RepID=UPI001A9CC929|nr:MFS transporter [Lysobacter sp. N42]